METCSGSRSCDTEHDEIVYDGRSKCPLCAALTEILELQKECEKLHDETAEQDGQLSMCSDACEGCPHKLKCITDYHKEKK